MLEVVLRNRIHAVLSEAYQPCWFREDGFLIVPHQVIQIATARAELARETKELTASGPSPH